jgi:hypothetical protein
MALAFRRPVQPHLTYAIWSQNGGIETLFLSRLPRDFASLPWPVLATELATRLLMLHRVRKPGAFKNTLMAYMSRSECPTTCLEQQRLGLDEASGEPSVSDV